MRFGIIDLGTNSVRFDVYESLDKGQTHRRIHREKVMVRLGDGLYEDGSLKPNAMARALAALDTFALHMKTLEITKITAFATCALRDASNSEEFISMVEKATGIRIEIISGAREAQLISQGILDHTYTPEGIFGLIDIGGGSTEVSVCEGNRVLHSHSFDLGANRLQQVFLKSAPPVTKDAPAKLRTHVNETLRTVMDKEGWPSFKEAVGSSGTIKAMAKILRKNDEDTDPFKRKALHSWVERITPMSIQELLLVSGMEAKRVDQIVAGAILLDEILDCTQTKKVWVTDFSLRDGIFEEAAKRFQ